MKWKLLLNIKMVISNAILKPAFAPSVKVEEIADGQTKMVSLTTFPSLDAVKAHFQKFIPTFN